MAHIVVCGYMIRYPIAGNLLAYFHYLLGLSKLGYQVVYLEESGWYQSCYDPSKQIYSDNPEAGLKAVQTLIDRFDVKAKVCFINRDTGTTYGLDWDTIKQALTTAEVLLNIGGVCWLPEFKLCQRRVLIDLDPLFTQLGKFAQEGLENYHTLFSYGVNIGQSDCIIPIHERDWHPTVPPVVPEIWTTETVIKKRFPFGTDADIPFTTIANWKAYGGITYEGKYYDQKREEFLKFIDLPSHTSQTLELALSNVDAKEREQLEVARWQLRNSQFSENFDNYQAYITHSKGEFSVAKQAYVKTRSGWFSDRSVCYLAASRPAILQDTGFSNWLPTGRGVLAFSSLEEAVVCIERVNTDYPSHCRAAREIAEKVFSYKVVLPRLFEIAKGMRVKKATSP